MIWVFDGDPDTKIVCEGYAKAFKYLMDNSTFQYKGTACHLVNGYMSGAQVPDGICGTLYRPGTATTWWT